MERVVTIILRQTEQPWWCENQTIEHKSGRYRVCIPVLAPDRIKFLNVSLAGVWLLQIVVHQITCCQVKSQGASNF